MAMPQCCYLAKGAKRPSHTTNTIKFDRIPSDPCNLIKRFDLCPFDQKNSTYLQPPSKIVRGSLENRDQRSIKNLRKIFEIKDHSRTFPRSSRLNIIQGSSRLKINHGPSEGLRNQRSFTDLRNIFEMDDPPKVRSSKHLLDQRSLEDVRKFFEIKGLSEILEKSLPTKIIRGFSDELRVQRSSQDLRKIFGRSSKSKIIQ